MAQKENSSTQRHILISGASGGLGGALAREFAATGVLLSLWGRNEERLTAVADACRAQGAETQISIGDTRDLVWARNALRVLDDTRPVDVAILNAGVSSGTLPGGGMEPVEDACRTLEVNALGAVNMGATLLERMTVRGSGQVVFISSLAALYPLPSSPAYCAAKSAVASYARAARAALPPGRTRVSVVYPGYVDTPMSRRLMGPQPFRLSAERAARHIRTRLEAGADSIVFPRMLAFGMRLLHLLPAPLADFFARRFSFTVSPDAESPAAVGAEPFSGGSDGNRNRADVAASSQDHSSSSERTKP